MGKQHRRNHDCSRFYSFYSDDRDDELRARMALAMVMLHGTSILYYGVKIGMQGAQPPAIEHFWDDLGVWFYHAMQRQGTAHDEAFRVAADYFCRYRCRTPLPWPNELNHGFERPDVGTGLPVSADAARGVNVADQQDDPDSMLSFFRQIAQVRQ